MLIFDKDFGENKMGQLPSNLELSHQVQHMGDKSNSLLEKDLKSLMKAVNHIEGRVRESKFKRENYLNNK